MGNVSHNAYRSFGTGKSPTSQEGGDVIYLPAAAALNVGQVVVIDSNGRAATSTTAGTLAAGRIGVVVGGVATNMEPVDGAANVGRPAATAIDQTVIVLVSGIARVVSGGAITVGAVIAPDTSTAGRVAASTTSPIGIALSAAGAAGVTILAFIRRAG